MNAYLDKLHMDWNLFSLQLVITFAHFLWQGTLVAIVLAVLLRALARDAAYARYVTSWIAFVLLPFFVVGTFLVVSCAGAPMIADQKRADRVTRFEETMPTSPVSSIPAGPTFPPMEEALANRPDEFAAGQASAASLNHSGTQPRQRLSVLLSMWSPYVSALYAVVTSAMLWRLGRSMQQCNRIKHSVTDLTDQRLLRIVSERARKMGLPRVPAIGFCDQVAVPVVVGMLRPLIVIPPAIHFRLSEAHLLAIIGHELAHIRRYDILFNLVQRIVEALLFFHPATWWISRHVSRERENCCDDLAAATAGRLSYVAALLQMAELCLGNDRPRRAMLATLSADGGRSSNLGARVRRLLGDQPSTHIAVSRSVTGTAVSIALLLIATLVAWGQNQVGDELATVDDPLKKHNVFAPEPTWYIKLAANEGASEMSRCSPVVVAGNRVWAATRDIEIGSGRQCDRPLPREPQFDQNGAERTILMRRKSADRQFIVEAAARTPPPNVWSDSFNVELRVLRASDGSQVGAVINVSSFFDVNTADVDVEVGGQFLLYADRDGVRVYRVETGEVETTLPVQTKRIDAVAFSPDRQWLVVSDQNDIHFWRWREQAEVQTIHAGRKIDCLVFTPDGQYLAEGPDSRSDIQLRDMRTLEVIATLQDEVGSPLMVSSMDVSADGRFLVAHNEVSVDPEKLTIPHRIHIWDLRTRQPVFQVATGEWVRRVAFSDDGRMVVSEFSGAAHGALLAAWRLPDSVTQRKVDAPTDAKDRLGDGIQWSTWGDWNGWLSGARLILPDGGLKPGDPLVVEYRLANLAGEKRTLIFYHNTEMRLASIGPGNRIGGFGLDWNRDPVIATLEPGAVYVGSDHLVSVDTTGLEPGEYVVALGSAFRFSDADDPSITGEIPHRGGIPFEIVGESKSTLRALPHTDIHWGAPVTGLQLGVKWSDNGRLAGVGDTLEAELFVANVTGHAIKCSVLLPHPGDGWLFNVEDVDGNTVQLKRPVPMDFFSPQRFVHLTLQSGEVVPITGEGIHVSLSQEPGDDASTTTLARPGIHLSETIEDAQRPWQAGDPTPRLVVRGTDYSAIFDITVKREAVPGLRVHLESGSVPFAVATEDDDSGAKDAAHVSGPERSTRTGKRLQRYKLVDGVSGVPLQGIDVTFGAWTKLAEDSTNDGPWRTDMIGTNRSDAKGIVKLRHDEHAAPYVSDVSSGWFTASSTPRVTIDESGEQGKSEETATESLPSNAGTPDEGGGEPAVVKLWAGTVVTGRLLWPDGTPAGDVRLNAGVYIHHQEWKKRLGMDLGWYSWDHGEWPNWSTTVATDEHGRFTVTVPPPDARLWIRVGTTGLGFAAITDAGQAESVQGRLSACIPFEHQIGGHTTRGIDFDPGVIDENAGIDLGDLRLTPGVKVRGRVVDANGNGLPGVYLTTVGAHGPHSGRSAVSGEDGVFEFSAMAPGALTVNPDARLRDENGQVVSRDVQAVFAKQSFTIPEPDVSNPAVGGTSMLDEIVIQALPEIELVLNWVDRREDTEQPIAYYGAFRVRGFLPDKDGQPGEYWTSETEQVERNGEMALTVKVPTQLLKAELILPADSKVTASYSDSDGRSSGPGVVELGDLHRDIARVIFGDDPTK